jgi:transcriptional regulator with XRE-family HTH domain
MKVSMVVEQPIGNLLRSARTAKGWTRLRLYMESGVHPNTIADIEHGRNQEPSFVKVVRLARALGMQPEDLCPVVDAAADAA